MNLTTLQQEIGYLQKECEAINVQSINRFYFANDRVSFNVTLSNGKKAAVERINARLVIIEAKI